jgi:pimeloyl-ACP methyl ester carboxylesterase
MPVLVVAGARDPVFSDRAAAMVSAIGPNAELAVVPRAGHALHLELPAAFVTLVEPFLSRSDTGMPGA